MYATSPPKKSLSGFETTTTNSTLYWRRFSSTFFSISLQWTHAETTPHRNNLKPHPPQLKSAQASPNFLKQHPPLLGSRFATQKADTEIKEAIRDNKPNLHNITQDVACACEMSGEHTKKTQLLYCHLIPPPIDWH